MPPRSAAYDRPAPCYLSQAIVALLLCSPMGMIALAYALKTRRCNEDGDLSSAWRCSRLALAWGWAATLPALALWLMLVITDFIELV